MNKPSDQMRAVFWAGVACGVAVMCALAIIIGAIP